VVAHDTAEDGAWERLTARHDGYRRLGLSHQRSVTAFRQGRWLVEDQVVKVGSSSLDPTFNLHWLMPDWPWEISEIGDSRVEMRLVSTFGPISIHIGTSADLSFSPLPSPITRIQLVRAGELIFGSGEVQPFMGWSAPTYANKIPVLSLTVTATSKPPFTITTEWLLPNASSHAI
jgi:hypothetical protein